MLTTAFPRIPPSRRRSSAEPACSNSVKNETRGSSAPLQAACASTSNPSLDDFGFVIAEMLCAMIGFLAGRAGEDCEGQLPLYILDEHLKDGRLTRILADYETEVVPVHLLYPQNRMLSSKVKAFTSWSRALFASQRHVSAAA
ncbi:hypothetical protein ACELLULO517_24450 [Acidisoma cellulosilytica]|uniref:LysR substrate-binding domain-containing protein n=1 Tax=Acidisoma cellulosilyticum TaxID=2802395 RepID=A0A963Z6I8_9PROT|nr:hypothetical protein [Acidisoma cellulosilyticum]MCB8883421.1 hypothetical protein [Acidisoma cellulosilyticum]